MRVVVFGANGACGTEIVKSCLEKGYTVVAAVRRPDDVSPQDNLIVKKIDLSDNQSLEEAIKDCDAVVSALGSGKLKAARQPTTLYRDSTRTIRAVMRLCNVKRIIVLSSSGVDEEDRAPAFYNLLLRRYLMNTYIDMGRMETILEESPDLEWTSLRLPYLQKGPSKEYLLEDRTLNRGNFKINYIDVGKFVANELEERKWIRKMPVIGYP